MLETVSTMQFWQSVAPMTAGFAVLLYFMTRTFTDKLNALQISQNTIVTQSIIQTELLRTLVAHQPHGKEEKNAP